MLLNEAISFWSFVAFTVAFLAWVAYLAAKK
jgi:hypothetical protein